MAAMRKVLIILLAIAIIVFVLVFSLNNQQPVALDFFFFETPSAGVAIWILLTFVLGALLGMLFTSLALFRARLSRRRAERERVKSDKALTRERQQAPKRI
ncbi:MAG: LapA family protein [Halomonadaceae bacterium]|nr:MAG: LapA family protein [Halomonadaceae bacterium]